MERTKRKPLLTKKRYKPNRPPRFFHILKYLFYIYVINGDRLILVIIIDLYYN